MYPIKVRYTSGRGREKEARATRVSSWKQGRFPHNNNSNNNSNSANGRNGADEMRPDQSRRGEVVCSGDVCSLPDAYNSGDREFARSRAALGDISNTPVPRDVFPVPQNPRRSYKETQVKAGGGQRRPPSSYLVPETEQLKEFAHPPAVVSSGSIDVCGLHAPAGLSRSKGVSAPKCARFNDGLCELSAAQCEYRHEMWTVAERIEHEARRAFADNSRLLEQNSVLFNRLREKEAVITDQSTEISTLLEEIHRLRLSSVPRYRSRGATGFAYADLANVDLQPVDLQPVEAPRYGPAAATAAAVAATALRRTPLRRRHSFQQMLRQQQQQQQQQQQHQLDELSLSKLGAASEINVPAKIVIPQEYRPVSTGKHVYANLYDSDASMDAPIASLPPHVVAQQQAAKPARRVRTPRKETPRKEKSRHLHNGNGEAGSVVTVDAAGAGAARIARGPCGAGFTKKADENLDKGSWLIKRLASA